MRAVGLIASSLYTNVQSQDPTSKTEGEGQTLADVSGVRGQQLTILVQEGKV